MLDTNYQVVSALTNAGVYNGSLVLAVHTIQQIGAPGGENFGFRNISFDQLAPEPASLGLLGLGAVAMLRRRAR